LHFEGAGFGGFIGGIHHEGEGGLDIGGGDGAVVVEVGVFAEVEDVGEGIGGVPGFGQAGVKNHLGVTFDQAVEEEAVDALGLGVGSIAGIEIGGVGFDDEDEMSRIVRRVRAGGEKE